MFEEIPENSAESRLDKTYKRLIRNKYVLAIIMIVVCDEYKGRTVPEVVNAIECGTKGKYIRGINGEFHCIGTTLEDNVFYADDFKGSIMYINTEMESAKKDRIVIDFRGQVYLANMLLYQYGNEYEKNHYEDGKKQYSIWTVPGVEKAKVKKTGYSNNEDGKDDCRSVHAIIELPYHYDSTIEDDLLRALSALFCTDLSKEEKEDILKQIDGIETKMVEEEVEEMCLYSQIVKESGVEEGKELGAEEKTKQIIRNMLEMNMNDELISAATKRPIEYVQSYRNNYTMRA